MGNQRMQGAFTATPLLQSEITDEKSSQGGRALEHTHTMHHAAHRTGAATARLGTPQRVGHLLDLPEAPRPIGSNQL